MSGLRITAANLRALARLFAGVEVTPNAGLFYPKTLRHLRRCAAAGYVEHDAATGMLRLTESGKQALAAASSAAED